MSKEQFVTDLAAAAAAGNTDQLTDLAKRAVEQFPEDAFGYSYLAESFMRQSPPLYAKAELCIAKAIQLEDKNVSFKERFAQMKEAQGMYDHAQILAMQILNIEEDNAFALSFLGLYKLRVEGNAEMAIPYFDRLLQKDSSNAAYQVYRAEALLAAEHPQQALEAVNAILANGFNEQAVVLQIQILQELKDSQDIHASYVLLLEKCPNIAAYHYQYGVYLMNNDLLEAAEAELAKAFALFPVDQFDMGLYSNLGQAALFVGKYAEAKHVLEKCVAAEPHEMQWQLMLAEAKVGSGDFAAGLADAEKLIANAGSDEDLLQMASLQKALAMAGLGQFGEAESIIAPLLKVPAFETDASFAMGVLRDKQGKKAKAYEHIKHARQRGSVKARAYLLQHLAAYLAETEKAVLTKLAPHAAAADQSPLIQKLTGSLWVFESIKSKQMEKYPADLIQKIAEMLRVCTMVFTEKGLLFVQNNKKEAAAYRVDKAGGDALQLELHPIDGLAPYMVRLRVDGAALLFSREDGEFMRFKRQDPTAIEADVKANFKQQVHTSEMGFLGDKAQKIVAALFA